MKIQIQNLRLTLVIFLSLIVFSFTWITLAKDKTSDAKNIFIDTDQDGLSDEEEKAYGTDPHKADTDGDGYNDGAEIKSGYDPLKPAPGDKLVSHKKDSLKKEKGSDKNTKQENENNSNGENLTEEISNKLVALLENPDPDKESITLDDLNSLIEETINPKINYDDLPEIDEKEIKIKKTNCKKLDQEKCKEKKKRDNLEYLTAISYILINNSPKQITSQKDISNFSKEILMQISSFSDSFDDSYFRNFIKIGEKTLKEVEKLEVPEDMLDIHVKGLKILKYGINLKNEPRSNKNDPLATIVSLSKVQGFISLLINFSNDIEIKLEKIGISDKEIDPLMGLEQ